LIIVGFLKLEPHPNFISDFTSENTFVSEIFETGVELESNN